MNEKETAIGVKIVENLVQWCDEYVLTNAFSDEAFMAYSFFMRGISFALDYYDVADKIDYYTEFADETCGLTDKVKQDRGRTADAVKVALKNAGVEIE